MSVAYVFVDILPELAAQHRAFLQAVGHGVRFAEQRIYVLALLAFVTLYGGAVYWVHLAGFAAYSGLIGYLRVERAERGPVALAVYAFAMALHVLAASVLLGWLMGARTPLSDVALARLFAVLAGGVVITTVTAELPGERRGRFWPFCMGAVGYATLLFLT